MQRTTDPWRRRVVLALVLLLVCAPCVARAAPGDPYAVVLWTAKPLTPSGTLTSRELSNHAADPEVLLLTVTSATGNADVKVEYQVAQDDAGTFGTATAQAPIVTSTATEFSGAFPEERHILLLPAAPTFRLVVTELTGTLSDTLVTATAVFRSR